MLSIDGVKRSPIPIDKITMYKVAYDRTEKLLKRLLLESYPDIFEDLKAFIMYPDTADVNDWRYYSMRIKNFLDFEKNMKGEENMEYIEEEDAREADIGEQVKLAPDAKEKEMEMMKDKMMAEKAREDLMAKLGESEENDDDVATTPTDKNAMTPADRNAKMSADRIRKLFSPDQR